MSNVMKLVRPLVVVAGLALSAQTAQAQSLYAGTPQTVTLTTPTYLETFNTLASTGTTSSVLPAGWRVREDSTNANTTYSVGTGSSNTGDVYSFGAVGSTDRALGGLWSGALSQTDFGAFFINSLGSTITSLTIAFNGEQYRNDTATTNQLAFSYSTTATTLGDTGWISVTALDFNTLNVASGSTAISATISGLSIADGSSFAIRWRGANAVGNDDALAIDNVSLTAVIAGVTSAVPEPATWAMMIVGFGVVGGSLRGARRRRIIAAA